MNEHIKAWLEALRSGKYKQHKTSLRSNDSFCCVGVECDVFSSEQWRPVNQTIGWQNPGTDLCSFAEVPVVVKEASGFSDKFYDRLYKWNDVHDKTFTEIADFIEESILNKSAYIEY
jgi:hypothetical protein